MPLWGFFSNRKRASSSEGHEDSSSDDVQAPLSVQQVRRGGVDIRREASRVDVPVEAEDVRPRRRGGIDVPGAARTHSFSAPSTDILSNRGVLVHHGAVTRSDLGRFQEMHRTSSFTIYQTFSMSSGELFVVKEFRKDILTPLKLVEARREVDLMRQLRECTVIPKYVADWETHDRIYLVMEFCEGGTLERALNGANRHSRRKTSMAKSGEDVRGPPRTLSRRVSIRAMHKTRATGHESSTVEIRSERDLLERIAVPLVLAVATLHASRLVHRRISPDHILFDSEGYARLGGLGMLLPLDEEAAISRVGEEPFLAPEVVGKPTLEQLFEMAVMQGVDEDTLPSYDHKADVWSIGRVVLEVMIRLQHGTPAGSLEQARWGGASTPTSSGRGQARGASSAGDAGPSGAVQRHVLEDMSLPPDVRELLAGVSSFSAPAVTFLRMTLKTEAEARPEAKLLLQTEWLKPYMDKHPELLAIVKKPKLSKPARGMRTSMNRASIEKARERQRNSNYASTEEKVDSDGRNDGEVTSGPRARVDKRSSLERRINQTSLFATYQF